MAQQAYAIKLEFPGGSPFLCGFLSVLDPFHLLPCVKFTVMLPDPSEGVDADDEHIRQYCATAVESVLPPRSK